MLKMIVLPHIVIAMAAKTARIKDAAQANRNRPGANAGRQGTNSESPAIARRRKTTVKATTIRAGKTGCPLQQSLTGKGWKSAYTHSPKRTQKSLLR